MKNKSFVTEDLKLIVAAGRILLFDRYMRNSNFMPFKLSCKRNVDKSWLI